MSGRARGIAWGLGLLTLLALGAAMALGIAISRALEAPAPNGEMEVVEVPAGGSLRQIAGQLEREGIVKDARAFEWLARWRAMDTQIRSGEYRLSPAWDAEKILRALREGHIATYPVVLPEGFTAADTAARLEDAGLADAEAFVAVALDPAVAAELGVEGPTLEGY